jgi:hypothetical protein
MKKTRKIPFDLDKYQSGAKAVFRDSQNEILDIFFYDINKVYKILVVFKDDENECVETYWETKNGHYNNNCISVRDIMLEEEYEEPENNIHTFWFNVYEKPNGKRYIEQFYSEKNADKGSVKGRLGKLKIEFSDEDLIK